MYDPIVSMIAMDMWTHLQDTKRKEALIVLRHYYLRTLRWSKEYEDDNLSLRTRNLMEDIAALVADIGDDDSTWQWYQDWDDELNAIKATMSRMGIE